MDTAGRMPVPAVACECCAQVYVRHFSAYEQACGLCKAQVCDSEDNNCQNQHKPMNHGEFWGIVYYMINNAKFTHGGLCQGQGKLNTGVGVAVTSTYGFTSSFCAALWEEKHAQMLDRLIAVALARPARPLRPGQNLAKHNVSVSSAFEPRGFLASSPSTAVFSLTVGFIRNGDTVVMKAALTSA